MFKFIFAAFMFASANSFAAEILLEKPLHSVEIKADGNVVVTGLVFRSDVTAIKPGFVISIDIESRCTELATQALIHGLRLGMSDVSQNTGGSWYMSGSCMIRR